MPSSQQDTEITLGAGRMLVLFFTFVLVCAVFFAIGFSLGRKTSMAGASNLSSSLSAAPAAIVRPSAAKQEATPLAPQTTDFSFYKSVSEKTADSDLTPAASQQPPVAPADQSTKASTLPNPAAPGYFVQVAAVSRQEDADALVEALKKKQYPAFTVSNPSADKFFHIQVGPYADLKDAEAMRSRLVADGYSPILKR